MIGLNNLFYDKELNFSVKSRSFLSLEQII